MTKNNKKNWHHILFQYLMEFKGYKFELTQLTRTFKITILPNLRHCYTVYRDDGIYLKTSILTFKL